VSWDAGSVTANGAYAVYPVKSSNVLIEDSEVVGASDAGIYVGQCTGAIVRNNVVYGNVAGIEIENTTSAEVYGNEAYDNTSGILVFTLPNLEKKDGMKALVRDNIIRDNNRANFAEQGTIVSFVPAGTGMLVLASDENEVRDNTISNNISVGILLVSLTTLDVLLQSQPDPETDPNPEKTYIHGNTFTGNGTDPQGVLETPEVTPLEDVVWDGVEATAGSAELCLGTTGVPSFRNFNGISGISDSSQHSTDTTPHECTLPELPPVSW
jgi:parallel beta-helix repeat protein